MYLRDSALNRNCKSNEKNRRLNQHFLMNVPINVQFLVRSAQALQIYSTCVAVKVLLGTEFSIRTAFDRCIQNITSK